MSKPKKKRTKKYRPGRPTIPTWVYDAWGQIPEESLQKLEDVCRTDLSLTKMGTWDRMRYGDLNFALKQFYAFAQSFDGSDEYELLATMATGALHALKNLADEEHDGPKVIRAALAPLEQALETYFRMMRELYRSEHEAARRVADRTNLTKALGEVAVGGVCILAPDEKDEEVCRLGCCGVAYVNSACEVGHLARDESTRNLFWVIDERGTFVRITEPTLMFFVETEPSKDPKWTTSD